MDELELLRSLMYAFNDYKEGSITVLELNDKVQSVQKEFNELHEITIKEKKKEFSSKPLKRRL